MGNGGGGQFLVSKISISLDYLFESLKFLSPGAAGLFSSIDEKNLLVLVGLYRRLGTDQNVAVFFSLF